MSKRNILVCDDEIDKYNRLVELLGDDYFQYKHVRNLSDLFEILNSEHEFDVFFLDLYFEFDKPSSTQRFYIVQYGDIKRIREKIGPKKKLIIYTKYTRDEIATLTKVLLEGLIDEWIDETDVYDETDSAKKEEAKLRLQKAIGIFNQATSGLSIYHFSDLHYGKQFKVIGKDICNYLVDQVRDQLKLISKKETKLNLEIPKIVSITGDIAQLATKEQFNNAKSFIKEIIENLEEYGVTAPIITITPGNHDFNWDLSIPQENKVRKNKKSISVVKKTEKEKIEYQNVKWLFYEQAFREIIEKYSTKSQFPKWWYYDYSKRFELKLFSINTSLNLTYKNNKVEINRSILDDLYKIVKNEKYCFGILLCHHPLNLWGSEREIEEYIDFLYSRLNIRIILSGHKHSNKILPHKVGTKGYIYEIQTGSMSVDKEDLEIFELPSYRIIKLLKSKNDEWNKAVSFTLKYTDVSYKPIPDEKGEYEDTVEFD
jgi:CheY-like chemotaxis protein